MLKRILIINGPNLNLLGKREVHIYGSQTFEDYLEELRALFPNLEILYFQSNHEGGIIDKLQEYGFEQLGIVLNPGGYSHTSISIRDTIAAISAPVVEVHISDIYKRESFRWHSYMTDVAVKCIYGKGLGGYEDAIRFLIEET